MRATMIFMVMMALCAAGSATTITSEFKSSGEGTMTHYSYLKEPKLEESGYQLGYKMGSLSYLEGGTITLNDTISYYDGQIDSEHGPGDNLNSTAYQKQDVEFNGNRGISEFYAKGFFPSNRALSAWKKIRYDDLSYNFSKSTGKAYDVLYLSSVDRRKSNIPSSGSSGESNSENRYDGDYDLGVSYSSSIIKVSAEVGMGPNNPRNTGKEYDFDYTAEVENGVIEIRDATGWTNRTGSLRVDWERDALMKGNFTIENDLESRSLFFPAAGEDVDWLPCCFDGTHPPIQNQKHPGVLLPEKLLPQYAQNRTGDSVSINCTPDSCPGFECIYTYAEGEIGLLSRAAGGAPVVQVQRIQVSKTVKIVDDTKVSPRDTEESVKNRLKEEGSVVEYEIKVNYNDAISPLTDIKVVDTLPANLVYKDGSSIVSIGDEENFFIPVKEGDSTTGTTLTYNLTELIPDGITDKDEIYINLEATVANNITNIFDNVASATGIARNETILVGVGITSEEVRATVPKN